MSTILKSVSDGITLGTLIPLLPFAHINGNGAKKKPLYVNVVVIIPCMLLIPPCAIIGGVCGFAYGVGKLTGKKHSKLDKHN
jgi:hypothetical protein